MRIGIDINGVLRDTIGKFTQLYEKHLIESSEEDFLGNTYELDMSGNTELIETQQDPFEYKKVSEVDSLELDRHFTFKSKEELFSFMYEEYAMELFGHAPSTEMTTFNILNDLYFELRDNNELVIVSSEIGKSKPSSLFFLSKFGCLLEKPVGKIVVKYNTSYNKHITSEYEISSLSEFSKVIKNL